jgi:hypothetical protein
MIEQSWLLERCEVFELGFWVPADPVSHVATACITGVVSYGLRPSTGLFGTMYTVTTSITGDIPAGATVRAGLCNLNFAGPGIPGGILTVGNFTATGCGAGLQTGEFFSPSLHADSELWRAESYFESYCGHPTAPCLDTRVGLMPIAATTVTPEPGTLALTATGLLAIFGGWRSARRKTVI